MLQDYKLGFRMLLKYPGLTLAGGLALAIAIGIGAGWYDVIGQIFAPSIPLPEGDRVVSIEAQNTLTNQREPRLLHDFLEWRRGLRTIEGLGAYRTETRNLVVGNTAPEPIQVAELTAAAFATARVSPLFGRPLSRPTRQPGAPAWSCSAMTCGNARSAAGTMSWFGRETGRHTSDRDWRDAEGLWLSGQSRRLDAVAAPRIVRCARGRRDQRHRQAGGRRLAAAGGGRGAAVRRTAPPRRFPRRTRISGRA